MLKKEKKSVMIMWNGVLFGNYALRRISDCPEWYPIYVISTSDRFSGTFSLILDYIALIEMKSHWNIPDNKFIQNYKICIIMETMYWNQRFKVWVIVVFFIIEDNT